MNRKLLALVLASAALALGACGDDDNDSSSDSTPTATTEAAPPAETTTQEDKPADGGAASELKTDADPSGQLKFTVDKLEGKAGKITITMDNPSDLPHAIEVEGNGVEEAGETVEKGGTSTVSADFKPGEYEFYCPVPGHKGGGMTGTLTVK
jgi:uncharacterized cupredoxin-like copper-binding protein